MTKGNAFALVHFSLMILAVGAIQLGMVEILWPQIMEALLFNGIAYIGGNVFDNGVKGRFYNAGLQQGAGV